MAADESEVDLLRLAPDFQWHIAVATEHAETASNVFSYDLLRRFAEVEQIVRQMRGNNSNQRAAVLTKLQPVFDVTLVNSGSATDVLTHVEVAAVEAHAAQGSAAGTASAETIEVLPI